MHGSCMRRSSACTSTHSKVTVLSTCQLVCEAPILAAQRHGDVTVRRAGQIGSIIICQWLKSWRSRAPAESRPCTVTVEPRMAQITTKVLAATSTVIPRADSLKQVPVSTTAPVRALAARARTASESLLTRIQVYWQRTSSPTCPCITDSTAGSWVLRGWWVGQLASIQVVCSGLQPR